MTMIWGNMTGRVTLTVAERAALRGAIETKLKSKAFMKGRLHVTTAQLWAAIKTDAALPAKIDSEAKLEEFGPDALKG